MSSTGPRNSVRAVSVVDILIFVVCRHVTTTERLNWRFSLTGKILCGNHQFDWRSRSDMPASAFPFQED